MGQGAQEEKPSQQKTISQFVLLPIGGFFSYNYSCFFLLLNKALTFLIVSCVSDRVALYSLPSPPDDAAGSQSQVPLSLKSRQSATLQQTIKN